MTAMKTARSASAVLLCAAAIGGCGADADVDHACAPFPKPTIESIEDCTGCAVRSPNRAVDDETDSYATVHLAKNAAGILRLRVRGRDNPMLRGGALDALVSVEEGAFDPAKSLELTASRNRTEVASSLGTAPTVTPDNRLYRLTVITQAEFDSVELNITAAPADEEAVIRVHELCQARPPSAPSAATGTPAT